MSGWEQLGEVLGGGIDRAGAFEQGRLRSAQTESALGLARQRQLENIAKDVQNRANDRFAESAAIAGVPQHLIDATQGGLGSDFASSMQGGLRQQEMGFRDTLGDELAPIDRQIAAEQGVTGKVRNPLDMMGSDSYVDLRNLPEAGAEASLYSTPTAQATTDLRERVGESQIRANAALEQQRLRAPTPRPGPQENPLSPYKVNPDFNPALPAGPDNLELIPRSGGPADPNYASNPMGSIERRFVGRVNTAAENTLDDLEYFMSMPPTASVGRFGGTAGMKNEHTLAGALMYQAKYQMSSVEENEYNMALGGFSEQLRTLEMQGMRGAAAIAQQFDGLRFEPKDDTDMRMVKMARVRQTIENGIAPNLANSSLPAREREYMEGLLRRVEKIIPFTPIDINNWKRAKLRNPDATLGESMQQRLGEIRPDTPGAAAAAPGAAPATDGWTDLGNGVRIREKPAVQ